MRISPLGKRLKTLSCQRNRRAYSNASQDSFTPRKNTGGSRWRTAGIEDDSHLPEPPFRAIRNKRGKCVHDDYDFHEDIGAGAFGEVSRGTHRETGQVVAIKTISKADSGLQKLSLNPMKKATSYHQEFELLRCVNEQQEVTPSPNNIQNWETNNSHVLRVIGAYDEHDDVYDEGNFYIVTELLEGGEMYGYLADLYSSRTSDDEEVVSEALAVSFAQQMLQAVEACHFTGFAHLDIKPENFLFEKCLPGGGADPSSRLVLADFGCCEAFDTAPYAQSNSQYVVGQDDVVDMDLHRAAGTLRYVSPEVINGYFSSRSDTWSIGAVLFLMLHGRTPFSTNTLAQRSAMPKSTPGCGIMANWEVPVSKELEHLVMRLLEPQAVNRFSATEALQFIEENLLHLQGVPVRELADFPARINSLRADQPKPQPVKAPRAPGKLSWGDDGRVRHAQHEKDAVEEHHSLSPANSFSASFSAEAATSSSATSFSAEAAMVAESASFSAEAAMVAESMSRRDKLLSLLN